MERQPCVYLLASRRNGALYVGVTTDLIRRVYQYRNDLVDGFSRRYQVHRLVWYEVHESKDSDLLAEAHALDADDSRQWCDHPAQLWLERAINTGLPARGGSATKEGNAWRVRWTDGTESAQVCFDVRSAEQHPDLEWVTLEDPRARAVISELPRWVAGQPLPEVRIAGLPDTVRGVWSLWEIGLAAETFSRKRFLPVFTTEEGRVFLPTARRVWDLLMTESIEILSTTGVEDAARTQGLQASLQEVQCLADERLVAWVDKHFADLPSLPVAKGLVVVHQVPRFLALRRAAGEARIALLVVDGLATDQWVQIREHLNKQRADLVFDEGACFAGLALTLVVSGSPALELHSEGPRSQLVMLQ